MFVSLLVCYLFCTMIMAIQSEGYTCFPMRSMNSMKDSIRKSCSRQEGASVRRESLLKTFAGLCVCVCRCSTYHKIRGFSESLYVCGIVTIIHLAEDSCHARHHSGLERGEASKR